MIWAGKSRSEVIRVFQDECGFPVEQATLFYDLGKRYADRGIIGKSIMLAAFFLIIGFVMPNGSLLETISFCISGYYFTKVIIKGLTS